MMRPAVLVWVLALAGVASASQPVTRTRLDYARTPAAASCPDEGAMRRSVAERLGYDPFHDEGGRTLRARVDRPSEWAVEIRLLDPEGVLIGERQLSSPGNDCAELASSTALAIAIALDPLVLARPTPPPAPVAQQPEPLPPPLRVVTAVEHRAAPVEPDAPAPARPGDPRLQLGFMALGALGTAPSATLGGTLVAGARFGGLYLGAEVRADIPGSKAVGRGSVQAGQVVGGAVVCGQTGWVGACGIVSGGVLRSQSWDVLAATTAETPWVTVGPRAFLDLPFGPTVRLRLQADLVVPVTRTTLVVGHVEVWQSPIVAFSGGAGLIFELPL